MTSRCWEIPGLWLLFGSQSLIWLLIFLVDSLFWSNVGPKWLLVRSSQDIVELISSDRNELIEKCLIIEVWPIKYTLVCSSSSFLKQLITYNCWRNHHVPFFFPIGDLWSNRILPFIRATKRIWNNICSSCLSSPHQHKGKERRGYIIYITDEI